ncbi:MAG TPA: Ppx/GppA phosphatase family protein [Caulobacteraceae bacterium]|jgi:exopolyphosphatase/guanosine-5'-triphosphate,3'-diphosphate pyrophosphatase|nr:Ppx/GppA phosphatase family protein [Caulobacteraceae bacterium]
MSDAPSPGERHRIDRPPGATSRRRHRSDGLYAALDLGTNNCRLLIAERSPSGFRVVDAYSRIVRLGEGLSQTGRLQPAAMDRAVAALKICGDRIRRRPHIRVRAIATQACRAAENGAEFLERVERESGLRLEIITPKEEARLSVAGSVNLLDRSGRAALVLDVGGGSTELSWLDLEGSKGAGGDMPRIHAWLSIPIGVVTLAERFPEAVPGDPGWFRAMVEAMKAPIAAFDRAGGLRPVFDAGQAHLIGTSGAITSLAGLHLGLARYDRSKVDGLWLSRGDCEAMVERLLKLAPAQRAAQPCIGPDRADLVLAGAAILQAVQELWPCARVRVADRGLREGVLLSMMAEHTGSRRSRRRRRGMGARQARVAA